jgi:hypothetical protein
VPFHERAQSRRLAHQRKLTRIAGADRMEDDPRRVSTDVTELRYGHFSRD